MAIDNPWRIAFPLLKLPPNMGGHDVLVIQSMYDSRQPGVVHCMCVDRQGRVYPRVVFLAAELKEASTKEKACFMLQVPGDVWQAPMAKSVIVPA